MAQLEGSLRKSAQRRNPSRTMAGKLQEDLLELIMSREIKSGERIPTEAEISDHFNVSRSTTREALKHLEQEGVLHAVQGQGRFLSSVGSLGIDRPITKYEGITEMLEGLGYTVSDAALSVSEQPLPERATKALGIPAGSIGIELIRLRFGNEEPLVFSVCYILRDALPGPVQYRDWGGSLLKSLEAHGNYVTSAAARIRAVNIPAEYAKRFSLADYGPWLLTEETCLTQHGLRVFYAEDYHRGDKISFNMLRRR